MEENQNVAPQNVITSPQAMENTMGRQLLSNENMVRTGDRISTSKMSIPSLEKHDSSSANL